MSEIGYCDMLLERSRGLGQVLSEGISRDLVVDQMNMTESIVGAKTIGDDSVWDSDAIKGLVIGARQNLEEMVGENDLADNLFIGGEGKITVWSVSKKVILKEYTHTLTGNVDSMMLTSDKKYLFVSDDDGY